MNAIGEITMCGTIGTARQASAGGHARHAAQPTGQHWTAPPPAR